MNQAERDKTELIKQLHCLGLGTPFFHRGEHSIILILCIQLSHQGRTYRGRTSFEKTCSAEGLENNKQLPLKT